MEPDDNPKIEFFGTDLAQPGFTAVLSNNADQDVTISFWVKSSRPIGLFAYIEGLAKGTMKRRGRMTLILRTKVVKARDSFVLPQEAIEFL